MRLFAHLIALAAFAAVAFFSPTAVRAEQGEGSDGYTPHLWTIVSALEANASSTTPLKHAPPSVHHVTGTRHTAHAILGKPQAASSHKQTSHG
jgi:hypothetical protein